MASGDTIKLSIHGIFKKTNSTLEMIKSQYEKDKYDTFDHNDHFEYVDDQSYVFPAHMELFTKLYKQENKLVSRTVSVTKDVTSAMYHENDIIKENVLKYRSKSIKFDTLRYYDAGKKREYIKKMHGSKRIPSSDYDINFDCHIEKDKMDFEFSIPKYLFGHSLAEFIPQINSKNYHSFLFNKSEQKKLAHGRLMEFIEYFLTQLEKDFKLHSKINRNFVEIVRLDLCFNQYFDSKEDALAVLDYQKKLNKKRRKVGEAKKTDYETSLYYFSQKGATWKIYHKGTEYYAPTSASGKPKESNFKKHQKINRDAIKKYMNTPEKWDKYKKYSAKIRRLEELEMHQELTKDDFYNRALKKYDRDLHKFYLDFKKIRIFKVDYLKKTMDKILRYEISMSGMFLSYHYKKKLYRKNCSIHQEAVKNYNTVHSHLQNLKEGFVKQEAMENYERMHNFYNRTTKFLIKDSSHIKNHHEGITSFVNDKGEYEPEIYRAQTQSLHMFDSAYFSKSLYGLLHEVFIDLFDFYQVEKIDFDDTASARIEKYNADVNKKIDQYNRDHSYEVGVYNMVHNTNKKHAIQLLSRNEKNELGFKTIRNGMLHLVLDDIKNGASVDQSFKKRNVSRNQRMNYKRDLEMLGISLNSMQMKKEIKGSTDYSVYYGITDNILTREKFYIKTSHCNIG